MSFWVRSLIRTSVKGSSGARVTSLRIFEEDAEGPYMVSGDKVAAAKRLELCAPFFDGCRYGPSA